MISDVRNQALASFVRTILRLTGRSLGEDMAFILRRSVWLFARESAARRKRSEKLHGANSASYFSLCVLRWAEAQTSHEPTGGPHAFLTHIHFRCAVVLHTRTCCAGSERCAVSG